jgi:hypothetical protein
MLTGADTSSYPVAQRAVDINIWNEKIVGMILDSQDESDYDDPNWGDYAIVTTPLVAGQRDYVIPISEQVIQLKRLDVCYDGQNPYRATPLDSSEIPEGLGNETQIDTYFSKAAPGYDTVSNAMFLYPRADATDVANGGYMRAFWSRSPKAITSSDINTGTYIPGFDYTFHPMLAYGPAYDYAVAKQMPQANQYAEVLADYEARLRRQYGSKQKDRVLQLTSQFIDYN